MDFYIWTQQCWPTRRRQHPTKHQLYGNLPLITKTIRKLVEPDTQGTAGEARTNSSVMYSYGPPDMAKQKQDDQLEHTCEDTGCSPEDLPEAMNDREKWPENFRDNRDSGTT